ncbi:hypothetical protein B0H16DRAFT_1470269 [Mycena metata]|uniref:F-box domain-containing protein n=1 Tax=Mycena metata TaxID=1033252 RepID=A0AAD7HVY2_9AGAR|nr:hypothetical protein B0H16DRAFT_1470269 [Mycena metata]
MESTPGKRRPDSGADPAGSKASEKFAVNLVPNDKKRLLAVKRQAHDRLDNGNSQKREPISTPLLRYKPKTNQSSLGQCRCVRITKPKLNLAHILCFTFTLDRVNVWIASRKEWIPRTKEAWSMDFPPTVDYQVAEIAQSLHTARALKDSLSLEITQLRMQLMRMEREEMHATRHILRCEFALAPIRRIPPEVLSQIFLCYSDLLGDSHDCLDVAHGVWLLGHICSHWRAVALSTPELWTSCNFSCRRGKRNALALVDVRLERTKTRPLCIRFHCLHGTSEDQRKSRCLQIMGAFIAHCSQWSELEIKVAPSFYSAKQMDDLRHKIPNLRKLHIIGTFFIDPRLRMNMITAFTIAPRLHSVTLESFDLWSINVALEWKQLASYSGSVQASPMILQDAPNLVDCTFYQSIPPTPGTSTLGLTRPRTHQLRHLHLHAGSCRPELLTLPALQSLRTSAVDIPILQSLERLLQRSMASLRTLHIDDFV